MILHGQPGHNCAISVCDQLLVYVIRADGEPAIYLAPGKVSNEQAAQLLELMAKNLRERAA